MKFDILTLFPSFFDSPLSESIMKRAISKKLIDVGLHNIRDFTHDKHKVVDDAPYGGGSGMVMKPGPIVEGIEQLRRKNSRVILLSPQGRPFDQNKAVELSNEEHLILVCGRYEGIDERVTDYVDETISIGDFVITGGELAALTIVDAVARLIPGVLGCSESAKEESFSWDILEYPHYTRPAKFRDKGVPDVLLSGNHEEIRRWRRREALKKTVLNRPDLLEGAELEKEDIKMLNEIKALKNA
ncbi:MAG: tRNA (guanosine(37)-N1)-methyltransferase TrmD [Proteobacteria bacterium]|nr:tRNA (guanosine(37)-N1)-methyltransferase TrmD [Pseudomonadota bacterium]